MPVWVIRGVQQAGDEAEILASGRVGIGAVELPDLSSFADKAALRAHLAAGGGSDEEVDGRTDSYWRFVHKMQRNDSVIVAVDGGQRFLLGDVDSAYRRLPDLPAELQHTRLAFWRRPAVAAEDLPAAVRDLALGSGAPMVQVKPRALENELLETFMRLTRTGFVKDGMAPAT